MSDESIETKECNDCRESKPLSDFYPRSKGSSKVLPYCKPCSKARTTKWARDNKEHVNRETKRRRQSDPNYYAKRIDKTRAINARRRERIREQLIEYKSGTPCADCGGTFHHVAMDFDHLPGSTKKGKGVSWLANLGYSWEVVLDEIAKCELVCANCHRVRTHASDRPSTNPERSRKYV